MTTKEQHLKKLGNAIRTYRGQQYSNGKWFRLPQLSKKADVERWAFRCRVAGYITSRDYDDVVNIQPLTTKKETDRQSEEVKRMTGSVEHMKELQA